MADEPASSEDYRTLVESVRDYAIFLLDEKGHIRSWNAGARLLKGYEASEVIGRPFTIFYTDEERAAGLPDTLLDRARAEGRVEDVGWRVRKDGSRFWASVVITALTDATGRVTGFGKVTRDLTDGSFRRFVEATHSIVWTTDGGGKPTVDSQSWRDFTGQTREEWLGRQAWTPVHDDDRPALQAAWERAKNDKHVFETEFRLRRKDGRYRWMGTRALPFFGKSGEVREWFGVTFDIHARKEAEEGAIRAARWWTTTLTSIGDAVVATDKDGAVRFMNPVAEELMAVSSDAARGRPLSDVFHIVNEETRLPVESPVEKVFATGAVVGLANHTVLISNSGAEIPIDDSAAPIRSDDGGLDGVVLVFRDVSTEKAARTRREYLARAGDELLRARNYREALGALARLAVPRLADWCAVEIREPGMSASEQIAVAHVDPHKIAFARSINERYPPDPNAPNGVPQVIRSGKSEIYPVVPPELLERGAVDEEHLRLIRELRLHSAIVVPLKTDDGVIGAITFVYAESQREYDEEDLAFAEDLAARAALVIGRHKAEAEARAANQAKDEFLATVSHELRTPLQSILGWAGMLKRGQTRDTERAIDTILRSAQSQSRIIDDILDMSRIVSGKLELAVSSVGVAGAVQAAVDAVRPAAQARRVELVVDVADDAGAIDADADRLQQIVWNLLSNAVKFSEPGGNVTVAAARAGDNAVRIEVKDAGRGIAREHLGTIFERFRQLDGGRTRASGGLGLGLAIVRYLAEAHGGHVEAHSAGLGAGATFVVTLPIHRGATPALTEARAAASAAQPLSGMRVLLVDDDADTRELVAEALELAGAKVEAAPSAGEALRAFARAQPNVLVSDIGMPGEDGYSLIMRVRALPEAGGGNVPAVALTAFARAEDVRRSREAGFDAHLAKPIDTDNLVHVLRTVKRCGA